MADLKDHTQKWYHALFLGEGCLHTVSSAAWLLTDVKQFFSKLPHTLIFHLLFPCDFSMFSKHIWEITKKLWIWISNGKRRWMSLRKTLSRWAPKLWGNCYAKRPHVYKCTHSTRANEANPEACPLGYECYGRWANSMASVTHAMSRGGAAFTSVSLSAVKNVYPHAMPICSSQTVVWLIIPCYIWAYLDWNLNVMHYFPPFSFFLI